MPFDLTLADNWPSLVRFLGPPAVELCERWPVGVRGAGFDHGAFDALLRRHVTERGLVDYAGLRASRGALAAYVRALGEARLVELPRDEGLALLLNAHNACVLTLLVEQAELPRSVRDIPARQRWRAVRWRVGGHLLSLDQLRREWLRGQFCEPRVHLAASLGTMGGAPLRAEAYRGAVLEAQLTDQARRVYSGDAHVRLGCDRRGRRVVELDPIHLWYRGDFEQVAGGLLNHVAAWHAPLAEHLASCERLPRVRWMPFDWRLNRAPRGAFVSRRSPRDGTLHGFGRG